MKITIISVGKIKEVYFKKAIEEYTKRLSAYCNLEQIEIPDEKAPESLSVKEETIIKNKEGERILQKIDSSSYLVVLDIKGLQLSSEALAEKIEALGVYGTSHLSFVIGGSLGLSDEIIKKADMKLSFSKMTFPHQLFKVILLEQIYRSFRIMKGEPYHK
ncbi:MAG: 23S rRNA (pseudouridine(1915)-N(3))-methyltransferase RlmH [Tissierellales bacterium]|nr:23S rRNA (pseudouridine(1915)-N(3))-methyltransferase RlmH [Tissierellales bacterium]MBN2827767.1 23S rRNA (pseudouridine(1915)-N(3))-methyltransferase RlmH [Tissierellales bacterium]